MADFTGDIADAPVKLAPEHDRSGDAVAQVEIDQIMRLLLSEHPHFAESGGFAAVRHQNRDVEPRLQH